MKRTSWRVLAAFLAFAALWWLFTLASRCDGGRPRPTELPPAGQPDGQQRHGPHSPGAALRRSGGPAAALGVPAEQPRQGGAARQPPVTLSLIHISEPTRPY